MLAELAALLALLAMELAELAFVEAALATLAALAAVDESVSGLSADLTVTQKEDLITPLNGPINGSYRY